MSRVEILHDQIRAAFAESPYPGDDRITQCTRVRCDECTEIRNDFRGQTPEMLSAQIIERHDAVLCLISPEAFQYFLPAYLWYSARYPESSVASLTRIHLCDKRSFSTPDPFSGRWRARLALLTPLQMVTIAAFLEFVKAQQIEGDEEENRRHQEAVEVGIKLWKTLGDRPGS